MSDDSARSRRPEPVSEALRVAARRLEQAGVDAPTAEARVLLAHALEVPLTRLDLRLTARLGRQAKSCFEALIAQRATRRPLAYLTGSTEFMGLPFRCDERALIPRPDTETLVEAVVEADPRVGPPPAAGRTHGSAPTTAPHILDVGTGTGCIGLSLAVLLPEARVVLTDVSPAALALARENADALGVTDRATFLEGRDLEPVLAAGLAEDITCVVSNPPYIPPGDAPTLPPEVAAHEPQSAWLGEGEAGLGVYERLIPQCAQRLPNLRLAAFEVGFGQADAVRRLCELAWPAFGVETRRDLSGIDRVVIAESP